MLLKCCIHCARKLSSGHGIEKSSFHSNPKERQCQRIFKLPHNFTHFTWVMLVMLKILQDRLHQYVNWELPMYKLDLVKAEEPEIKSPTSVESQKKHSRKTSRNSRKTSTFASLTTLFWLCGSQQTVENSEKGRNFRPPHLPPEKPVCRSRSNS